MARTRQHDADKPVGESHPSAVEKFEDPTPPMAPEAAEPVVEPAASAVEEPVETAAPEPVDMAEDIPEPIRAAMPPLAEVFGPVIWTALKAWVRRELDLHRDGVDHNEREHQNP